MFHTYRRKNTTELRCITKEEVDAGAQHMRDHTVISISQADIDDGSPKMGDMIARNPCNPEDQWLVNENYFLDNFELVK